MKDRDSAPPSILADSACKAGGLHHCQPPAGRRFGTVEHGFTLVELMVVVALTALMMSMGLPFLTSLVARRALEGAAAELATDLRFARSEAVARNAPVVVRFAAVNADVNASNASSCYTIHAGSGAGCDCLAPSGKNGESPCQTGAAHVRTVRFPQGGRVQVAANIPAIVFTPLNGVAAPGGTITVTGTGAGASSGVGTIRHVVSAAGRVRSCSVGAASFGLRAC